MLFVSVAVRASCCSRATNLRFRFLLSMAVAGASKAVVGTEGADTVWVDRPTVARTRFRFHAVFGDDCSQAEVYHRGVQRCTAALLRGYNATVFAYGCVSLWAWRVWARMCWCVRVGWVCDCVSMLLLFCGVWRGRLCL